MERRSTEKLQKRGFILLRTEDSSNTKSAAGVKYIIKQSSSLGSWRKLEEFPTKAARERRLKELLVDETPYLMDNCY